MHQGLIDYYRCGGYTVHHKQSLAQPILNP